MEFVAVSMDSLRWGAEISESYHRNRDSCHCDSALCKQYIVCNAVVFHCNNFVYKEKLA
jgi:hypothetical protein